MRHNKTDIKARLSVGHVRLPRIKEGGLTAAFFSIWVDARYGPGTAFRRALNLIGAVRALADTNPEVELATSADQVRAAAGRGHVAALLGVEGDRKSTRLNSSHSQISYAVFCLKKKHG